ncbi:MAG: hypothetical protein JWO13_1165 [Acidobacteriales bacterium]|nr:hypothetical protein [Terriglobales bacterium]
MRCKWRTPHSVLITIFLLMTTAAHAQSGRSASRSQPPPPDGPKYTLSGRVVNSETGDPIPNALVQVTGARVGATFTDREGRFEIPNVFGPKVMFSARKPGFFDERETRGGDGQSRTTLDLEITKSPLLIKLVPEGIIFGRVLVENNEPFEGVSVRAMHYVVRRGRKVWEAAAHGTTDDQGDFRIAGLKPGSYFLATGARFGQSAFTPPDPNEKRQAYVSTFYPGVADLASAAPIALRAGGSFQLEMSLKLTPVFLVTGTIKGIAPGQQVNLKISNSTSDESSPFPIQRAGNRSEFRALVPAGLSTLFVTTQGDPDHVMYAEKLLDVKGDTPNVYVELSPLLPIPVNVRVENTKPPVTQFTRQFGRPGENVSLTLHPVDVTKHSIGAGRDGNRLTMAINAPPGSYVVDVSQMSESYYVQAIVRGAVDLTREEMTVVAGDASPVEITVRDNAAVVLGRVQDGDSGAAATIILVPDRSPLLFRVGNSSPEGIFQLYGMAPGDYRVYAFDYADDLEYSNPQVLAEFADRSTHVTLDADKTTRVTLNVIRRLN